MIKAIGPLSHLSDHPDGGLLTYLSSARFADELQGTNGHLVLTTSDLADQPPGANTLLVCSEDPEECFYRIVTDLAKANSHQKLTTASRPSIDRARRSMRSQPDASPLAT